MDASVALMNQYTMIANQFPLQTNTTPTTSVGTSTGTTTTTTTEDTNATANVETVENPKLNAEEKKIVDTLDNGAGPSTSKAANIIESAELDSMVTIEDIGRTDPSDPDDESISEVRRRRLQRFEAKGVDS